MTSPSPATVSRGDRETKPIRDSSSTTGRDTMSSRMLSETGQTRAAISRATRASPLSRDMSCATTSRSRRPGVAPPTHTHTPSCSWSAPPSRSEATTSLRWNALPAVSDQTRRTVSGVTCPPSSPTSHCCTSASVNGGTSMRSTTSSFHSSSHGDCDTADDRAVATSCTSPCWTIHASAWLLAGSSRCASSTRRITGPPRERARNESASDSTVRAKLPSELIATSPRSGSRAPSGMPAGQVAPETLTTVGIGDVGVPIHRCASAAVTRCVLPTPGSPTTSTLRPACTCKRTCSARGRTTSVRRATPPRASDREVDPGGALAVDGTSMSAATATPLNDEHPDPRRLPSGAGMTRVTFEA